MRPTLHLLGLLPFFIISAALAPLARTAPPSPADSSLRVMSFNIRFNNPDDGEDAWPNRRDRVAQLIRFHDADVVGVQEALLGQLQDLQERLPEYDWVGVGRADGKQEGEYSAIIYRDDRLALLDHDTFWLSETPQEVGSVGWDAALERIVTWARFRDRRTGEVFFHFNTHFDHRGEEARRESAALILEQIDEIAGSDVPVVLTGDFNALEDSAPYRILTGSDGLRDAYYASKRDHYGPSSTWTGFEEIAEGRRIDYVFVNDEVEVLQHGIITDRWGEHFPSDHLPVLAEIVLQ